MPTLASAIALVCALTPGALAQELAPADEPFPPSTALAEGLSPEALARLDALVQGFVDDGEVVGAELLVVKNGRSILHAAYGWRDRESETPMETGSVFCVRSMTKPVVGAAVLMLVDDDRLELDDPVARYLPAFDVEGSREITVEQLLAHTSGLPMSLILARDLRELDGIGAVAALGGGHALGFEPGSAFQYSDQGADTLTALVEVASGMPAADFVRARVLEPLGMFESACVLGEDHPLRARACSAYAGSRGAWTRFWSPADPPLFPFFLGSQGLYSTARDYARFLELWLRKGRIGKQRLLGSRFVRKALTPGPYPLDAPTGFPGLRSDYGYLMQLWTGPGEEREVVAFGHTGSDGTHAWAFPAEKALALYFTQSRGTATGLRVEEALGELLLGAPYDPNQAAPPLEQYLGYYWEGEDDLYRAVVRDGDDLALEILGKAVVPLTFLGDDRWKMRPNPTFVLAFDRSEAGEVTGYHVGDHQEFRFEPSAELPSAGEVAGRVAKTHGFERLETLGALRTRGELRIDSLGREGELVGWLAWPDRFRADAEVGGEFERITFDGERVWYASRTHPAAPLEGARAEFMRQDVDFARFGDWRRWHPTLRVIQRLERDGRELLVVRAGDTSAPARTYYVEATTGRLLREDGMALVEGMGRIGRRLSFGDFRDVSGLLMPFRTETELANPLIGTIVTTISEAELVAAPPAGTFRLGD